MTGSDWLAAAMFGAAFGVIGQLIRTIGGLKKMGETAGEANAEFSASRLLTSVAIGGVAGALAAISLEVKVGNEIQAAVVLGLMGAGYAGADFIEAFMHRHSAAITSQLTGSSPPTAPPPANHNEKTDDGSNTTPSKPEKPKAVG